MTAASKTNAVKHNRIRYAIVLAILVALLVGAYVLAGGAFSQFEQSVLNATTQRNETYIEEFTRNTAEVLEEKFQGATEATGALAVDPRIQEIAAGEEYASRLLSLERESQFDHVRYVDAQGVTHTSSGETQDVSYRDYYIEGMKGNSGITYTMESVVNGGRQISFYAPVKVGGQVTGVIVTIYGEATLAKSITTYFYGHQASAGIITRDGEMLVNADSEFMRGLYEQGLPEDVCDMVETSVLNDEDTESVRNAYTNLEESSFDFYWQGTPNTGYIVPLKSVGLSLYMIFPYQATLDTYQSSVDIGSNLKWSLYIILAVVFWIVVIICALVVFQTRKGSRIAAERDAAERANEAKTNFLFNMSHDIRTPMNAIIGYTDLIRKHQDDPARCADYLDKMDSSSHALLSIIDNVLEMSRIEKGALELEEHLNPAGSIVLKLADIYGPLMESKGITFTCTEDVKSAGVYVDSTKMLEVIDNLLSNAYKYTEPGGHVALSLVEIPDDVEGRSHFRMTVSDDGRGMSDEYLTRIYEQFSRERTSTESKEQGTGLGMSIVKNLVDVMNGEIEITTKLGEGTAVAVTIPHRVTDHIDGTEAGDAMTPMVARGVAFAGEPGSTVAPAAAEETMAATEDAQPQEPTGAEPAEPSAKRLLLVEDNDLNAEIAIEVLGDLGYKVERASDGVEGVEMVTNAEPGYYDAVVMDVQMPRMNGYEATRAIRALDDPDRATIPIIAMTANAFDEDRRNAAEAGMDGFVPKPINIGELMQTLAKFLG